jgi:prohibitin 2
MSLHNVGQRQVGIVYNFSGTIAGKKDPGVVMTWPWQHVKTENVGIQHEEYNLDVTNAAVSADQQPIYARLAVNLQVDPERVVDLYKRIGPEWKHILLESRVLQDFKEITSGFKTADITNRREELRIQAKERLTAEMEPYDIRIIDVFVRNIGFSEAYSRAIEEKLVQQQAALRAQFKADAVRKEAEGEASAIRLKGAALRANPEVLRLRAIETLNPNAQVIICTGRTCPSFLPSGLAGR